MAVFGDFTESWIFCGFRILLYKWERAVVLAKEDMEFNLLKRMERKLRDEMAKEKSLTSEEVVLQTSGDDRYAGPMINGRFQIMESFTPKGTFYIADHEKHDLLLRVAGAASDVRRFASIKDAEDCIQAFTNGVSPVKRTNPGAVPEEDMQESSDMARTPKANAAALKAADVADKKIGTKAAAKNADADKQMKEVVKESKAGKVNGTKVADAVPARAVKDVSGRKDTIASMFRDLIAKPGKMTDEQIHAKVEEAFGKKIAKNAVSHYRADLERRRAAGKA